MRAVVRLTGIAPDTLRAWERRYGAVEPDRTDGGARRYSDTAVQRLVLLRTLVQDGHSIGEIARLDDEALRGMLGARSVAQRAADPFQHFRESYLAALVRFDASAAEAALVQASRSFAPRELVIDGLVPIMREVGDRWHAGTLTIAQEHLATQQVRTLLESRLSTHAFSAGAPKILFAAPDEHRHDLGLLCAASLAALHDLRPVMLGAEVPVTEIASAAERAHADVVVLACARGLTAAEKKTLPPRLRALAARCETWLGVAAGHALSSLASRLRVFHTLDEFDRALVARYPR